MEPELTENPVMNDIKHGIASLQAIRGLGVSVAIGDFGTGFSSLGCCVKLLLAVRVYPTRLVEFLRQTAAFGPDNLLAAACWPARFARQID